MTTEKVVYIEPWALDGNAPTSFLTSCASTVAAVAAAAAAISADLPIASAADDPQSSTCQISAPTLTTESSVRTTGIKVNSSESQPKANSILVTSCGVPLTFSGVQTGLPLRSISGLGSPLPPLLTAAPDVASSLPFPPSSPPPTVELPLPTKMPAAQRIGELWACPVCQKGFRQRSNVEVHYRIHTGDRPYTCRHCDRTFTQQSNCRKHEATHLDERPHGCEFCGKRFVQSNNLRKHIMIHSGEKPLKCSICGKAFAQASNLSKHEQAHRNERLFACHLCPRAFVQSSNLKKHIEIVHARIRRFHCLICNQRAGLKSNLLRHVAQVHGFKERVEAAAQIGCDLDNDPLETAESSVISESVDQKESIGVSSVTDKDLKVEELDEKEEDETGKGCENDIIEKTSPLAT